MTLPQAALPPYTGVVGTMVYLTLLAVDRLTEDLQIAEFEVILSLLKYYRMLEGEGSAHRLFCNSFLAEYSRLD